ncbi:MAG: VWA domain-containing protein [Campylobacterota bacterium]|nr:VWA domain-containing protein [Campylobacterota bacterium]
MFNILEFEENAGKGWEKFISKKADASFLDASVSFSSHSKALKIFHHLMGADQGKELHVTDKRFVNTSRSFLEKISNSGNSFFLSWQDEKALYLPATLSYFPTKKQNETLYYWLVAMSVKTQNFSGNLLSKNFSATQSLRETYPGFKLFYDEALELLLERNDRLSFVKSLDEENLTDENSLQNLDTYPCPFWIYPPVSKNTPYSDFEDEEEPSRGEDEEKKETLEMKKKANKMDDKKETDGFVAFLPESIMSILEQVNVDRAEDDSFDEDAMYNAEDLDEITLGQKKANLNARIKMDLDLAPSRKEEYPLGSGTFLDEWDYSKQTYLQNYVKIKPYLVTNIEPLELEPRLKKMVRKIEGEIDLMELDRVKNNRLPYGDEINLDTWIDYKGHKNKSGHHQKFYESFEKKTRNMSTLILADVSLSTEAGITQEIRIIDVIKDGLIVFSEALSRLNDKFAIYTFSSNTNKNVRFEIIKNFKENYTDNTRGRIDAIKPGYYTRLGAAIRESTKILEKERSENKLLLIISDGKPNDVDRYDGRYGIEDTKKSITEAKKLGITPFCITVDLESKDYLPYLFGKNGYTVVRDGKKLPQVLPEVYMNLTK